MVAFLFFTVLSFIAGSAIGYLAAKLKIEKEHVEIVNNLATETEEKIADAIYFERFRIARELHDDLIQRLSAIRLRLDHTLIYAERQEVITDIERAKKKSRGFYSRIALFD